jgi:hypothetical protein
MSQELSPLYVELVSTLPDQNQSGIPDEVNAMKEQTIAVKVTGANQPGRPSIADPNRPVGYRFSLPHSNQSRSSTNDTEQSFGRAILYFRFSAKPDAGDLMKRLSVQPAGMSAFNFFEGLANP